VSGQEPVAGSVPIVSQGRFPASYRAVTFCNTSRSSYVNLYLQLDQCLGVS
jgi:hypothetical protein